MFKPRRRSKLARQPLKSIRAKVADAHIRKVAKLAIVQQAEHKLWQIGITATVVAVAGTVVGLTDILQGTTTAPDTVRVGDQVRPLRLQVRMYIQNAAAATDPDLVRIMVVKWHGRYGLNPLTMGQLLGQTPYVIANHNVDTGPNRQRLYTILYDKTYDVPVFQGGSGPQMRPVLIDLKGTGTINWAAASNTDSTGAYYLVACSLNGTATYQATSILDFTDM